MEAALRKNQRRRVPRIPVDFPVTLTWGRKRIRCRAREFSEFGILLTPPQKELVGENIQLDLTLEPPSPALSLSGVVVYAVDKGIGVRFENVSPDQQAPLKNYVQARGIGIVKAN